MFKKSFIFQLKTVYWIEKHLCTEILRLEKASTTLALKAFFRSYYAMLKKHAKRIECSFYLLHEKRQTKKSETLSKLFDLTKKNLKASQFRSELRDVQILSSITHIESEGIKAYEKLLDLAYANGEFEVADLIEDCLEEEREARHVFNTLYADRQKKVSEQEARNFVSSFNIGGYLNGLQT
ncbi:MAG: DUF892 family protein [Bacteroidia bacterium]|nr:DUF892 family protein [Bacteroidia bacterium]